MLKYLYPNIKWDKIKTVGFDLDGTLYDELDFIVQVYRSISELIASVCQEHNDVIYKWIIKRWLEKGSSYPHIFEEILTNYSISESMKQKIIRECLTTYREFTPQILLSERVRILLDYFHQDFPLFLITDGHSTLQMTKFHSLGLSKWFEPGKIAVSGLYGSQFQKPSPFMAEKIRGLDQWSPNEVVFFGDREIDRVFSANLGFQFIKVFCMVEVER